VLVGKVRSPLVQKAGKQPSVLESNQAVLPGAKPITDSSVVKSILMTDPFLFLRQTLFFAVARLYGVSSLDHTDQHYGDGQN
jgi:hypothetical protein